MLYKFNPELEKFGKINDPKSKNKKENNIPMLRTYIFVQGYYILFLNREVFSKRKNSLNLRIDNFSDHTLVGISF